MSKQMKIVGTGDNREILHGCVWCGEYINTLEGDDCVTHGTDYYHVECFEEAFYDKED